MYVPQPARFLVINVLSSDKLPWKCNMCTRLSASLEIFCSLETRKIYIMKSHWNNIFKVGCARYLVTRSG